MQETASKQTNIEKWFDEFIAHLRTHQVQIETDTASEETKKFYETIFTGSDDEIAHLGKMQAQQHFVRKIIIDYVGLIKHTPVLKLAFDFNDSEVLVWAEINDDDFETEKELLRAEAKINAKYHNFGFDMETTIVEKSDSLLIPNHYNSFK